MRTHQTKFLKLRSESLPGFVYLVQVVGTDKFKIGRTTNVQERLCQLQTGNPFKIRYVYHAYVPSVAVYERELHDKFSRQREIGEWFTLTQEDVKYCILLMRLVQLEQPHFPTEVKAPELKRSAEQIFQLKAKGWGKAKIIFEVWGATRGGEPKYRAAVAEYERLVGELVCTGFWNNQNVSYQDAENPGTLTE